MAKQQNEGMLNNASAQAEQLKKQIADLDSALMQLEKSQQKLGDIISDNVKDLKSSTTQIKSFSASLKDLDEQTEANSRSFKTVNTALQQNKAAMQDLVKVCDRVSTAQTGATKAAKAMGDQVDDLNKAIDDQEKRVDKSREKFNLHAKSIEALKGAFEKIKTSAGDFAPALDEAAKGFNALQGGLENVKTGFKTVDGVIKTTAFGVLLMMLQSVVEYLTKTKDGSKILSGVLAVVGKVVEKVNGFFADMGRIIIDAVTHPVESLKAMGTAIVQNIINRFGALGVILDGITHLDFKKMADGVLQGVTGITQGTDKIKTAFEQTKKTVIEAGAAIVKTYNEGTKAAGKATEKTVADAPKIVAVTKQLTDAEKERQEKIKETIEAVNNAGQEEIDSKNRTASAVLQGYAKEVFDTNTHYAGLLKIYQNFIELYDKSDEVFKKKYLDRYISSKNAEQAIQEEQQVTLAQLNKKFQEDDLAQLNGYLKEMTATALAEGKNAEELARQQLDNDFNAKNGVIQKIAKESGDRLKALRGKSNSSEIQKQMAEESKIIAQANAAKLQLQAQYKADKDKLEKESIAKKTNDKIQKAHSDGDWKTEFQLKQQQLNTEKAQAIEAAQKKGEAITTIEESFKLKQSQLDREKRTADLNSQAEYLKGVDKVSNAVSSIFGKNTVAAKAAFKAHQAASAGQVIIDTQKSIMGIWAADAGLPFIGVPKAIAETAIVAAAGAASLASIIKQKPGFATGGQYVSDGRGAMLPGYSRTDNTNALLRSGEAVVVSEAMRDPWARNLVSAINVAYGGRDFSVANPQRGYAIGGIFTDGGNSNRYYNQPLNDVKDLANTLAYQMVNNFPPVYVDVKDINTQQSILAQTINRVNL